MDIRPIGETIRRASSLAADIQSILYSAQRVSAKKKRDSYPHDTLPDAYHIVYYIILFHFIFYYITIYFIVILYYNDYPMAQLPTYPPIMGGYPPIEVSYGLGRCR